MKKLFYIALVAAMVLSCAGCGGKDAPADETAATTTATQSASEGETSATDADTAETTYIAVTDEDGTPITDVEGNAVTMAAQVTYVNVTDDTGAAVTDTEGGTVTSAVVATTAPDADVTDPALVTTAATTPQTPATTPKAPAAATTKAPAAQTAPKTTTTTTTTAPTAAPTTAGRVPNYDDPWQFPCDWKGMEADCKAYVESVGLHWDENLRIDNGSWTGNEYTYNQKFENQLEKVKRLINFDHNDYNDTYFKCVFVPDEAHDGHYKIYIVHSSGKSSPNDEGNPDYIDLAKKAVN